MADIMVYCFIDGGWMGDVAVIAVCGKCGDVIGSHISSNENWAKHDITREYHHEQYRAHMTERHDGAGYTTEWVADVASHSALQELVQQQQAHSSETPPEGA